MPPGGPLPKSEEPGPSRTSTRSTPLSECGIPLRSSPSESIIVDAGFEAADLEAVSESEAVGAALDDAARIAHGIGQLEIALRLR